VAVYKEARGVRAEDRTSMSCEFYIKVYCSSTFVPVETRRREVEAGASPLHTCGASVRIRDVAPSDASTSTVARTKIASGKGPTVVK
jgi:hypothetical protein